MTTVNLAEEKLNQFLPLLKESYPTPQRNHSKIKEIVALYKATAFSDNIIVGLVDVSQGTFVYLSDNTYRLSGYFPKQLVDKNALLPFKIIHPTHHSFPFKHLKWHNEFMKNIPYEAVINTKNYFCGIKILDGNGKVRRVFIKTKTLLVDEQNNASLIACFIEDITHLVKNETYWLRVENENQKFAYVHQRGKKEFKNLISKKEKETLLLMAQHKSNIEIANTLFVSTSTIESHRKNMIKRLGAASSSALIHLCKMANII